jgi:hypothetical protein
MLCDTGTRFGQHTHLVRAADIRTFKELVNCGSLPMRISYPRYCHGEFGGVRFYPIRIPNFILLLAEQSSYHPFRTQPTTKSMNGTRNMSANSGACSIDTKDSLDRSMRSLNFGSGARAMLFTNLRWLQQDVPRHDPSCVSFCESRCQITRN